MMEVTAGDETSAVAEQAAEDDVSIVSAAESFESGVDLGDENDDEATRVTFRKGRWGWHPLHSSCRSGRPILSRIFCCKLTAAVPESSAFVTRVPHLST